MTYKSYPQPDGSIVSYPFIRELKGQRKWLMKAHCVAADKCSVTVLVATGKTEQATLASLTTTLKEENWI